MKCLIAFLTTTLWTLCCHSQVLIPSDYVLRGLGTNIMPSYNVDGSLHFSRDNLLNQMFDHKHDSRDIFVDENLRTKRATSFSYMTPDSSRSEHFDTYVDPRTKDGHALNRYQGHVSWTSPEGIPFSLDYTADGGGFHPQAHHLPDSPNHRSYFVVGLNP